MDVGLKPTADPSVPGLLLQNSETPMGFTSVIRIGRRSPWRWKVVAACLLGFGTSLLRGGLTVLAEPAGLLPVERLAGEGVWVSPHGDALRSGDRPVLVRVWFERQLLGDGGAYERRVREFASRQRRELRQCAVRTLKQLSAESRADAEGELQRLARDGLVARVHYHWIVNGFTCETTIAGLESLQAVPGVRKIFVGPQVSRVARGSDRVDPETVAAPVPTPVGQDRFRRPWYIRALLADRVWRELGITGAGTLNVIHDNNFMYPGNVAQNVYRNPHEVPGNGMDDDGNGLIDDCYGFNFDTGSALLSPAPRVAGMPGLHGTMCAAIVCGTGTEDSPYAFGVAPQAQWAGVISQARLEPAVEWAIEQGADTYSMSFSRPNLGELRSHWRKIMEHGALCGVYFVSGAGNFAQTEPVPVQMRTPEDIPQVVFAAAGVQRDLSRTPFSSRGPVEWNTEHYRDGRVPKPEVCAFNAGLPLLLPDGSVRPVAINGNSFAGPMFCGAIALMLAADPDLLPWDLREIITSTATDVGPAGVDDQTGYGLINCFRAVKEVLRRKALREGADPRPFSGRSAGDTIDIETLHRQLAPRNLVVMRLQGRGTAIRAGLRAGDVILRVDDEPVRSVEQWQAAVRRNSGRPFRLLVERNGKEIEMTLESGPIGVSRVTEAYEALVFE